MTPEQKLVLSFFDKEIPREMTNKSLTVEMKEAGIGPHEGSPYPYYKIIHFLQVNDFIKPYKDPSKKGQGALLATGRQLYILSDTADQILNKDKMLKEQGKEILEIKNQIARQFSKSDWLDLGYSLGCYDIIENHGRLLRSLSFGDEDYEGNILEVLTSIIKKDPKNFQELKHFISDKYSAPIVSEYISTAHAEAPKKMITFSPQVFEIPLKAQNEKLVTVMLPFKLQASFTAVKNACDTLNLECKKADDIWENATFIQDIFELIFTSKVVVADFTGKNPNVFYEVGIAHTLGKAVIPITQSFNDVPSDLGHHRALKYLPNEQGYADLTKELQKRLETLMPKPQADW